MLIPWRGGGDGDMGQLHSGGIFPGRYTTVSPLAPGSGYR